MYKILSENDETRRGILKVFRGAMNRLQPKV